ncbi:MAG: glycosyltransferase family 2 protein [Hyphomicrobiales bacterium]|nr:MAG: glycosyltransferase family 2 protein [Hyphomicrobiales bacterium]
MSIPSPKAVVIVPTFRRPDMLRETLHSLAAQDANFPFVVLVVENDAAGLAGQDAAFESFARERLNGVTIVEPMQGNVQAINAGFAAALKRFPDTNYFLMIDDDEIASPHWLERMVSAADSSGAGIVGGPVNPRFAADVGRGMQSHPVFWPINAPTGPLPMIYGSGNCLVRRSVFERLGLPAFDVAFNFLGGGDTDFFTRARNAGFAFYWQADALITETVPPARTQTKWVFKRGLRIGAINRRIERKSRSAAHVLAKDAAILALSPIRFVQELVRSRSLLRATHPVNVALGRLLSIGGIETSQYRASR